MGILSRRRRFLFSLPGITAGAFLVEAWFDRSFRWSKFAAPLFASFVYTVCIGTLAGAAASRVWPAAMKRPFAVRWLLYVAPMGAAIALGTLLAQAILWNIGFIRGTRFWTAYLFSELSA